MNLKMQMRPRRAAGVADVGNDLPGFDLLQCSLPVAAKDLL